ncbi:V-type ATP synthase subunit I [Chlamydia psittaci]|uniref:V-type ATP synthase subunit I n=1 Tax=Chlamydia psittaci TaxID=83554 RepID=UPI0001F3712D|nr:V-type ATP synthase subunit I [Chlamydia psittaci]AFS19745.1 V-type ATP synthase subunit I [Chlamydia psittaci 84/55]AFS22931.1 V-type ATP synthase subunit I [Chlamydia psittaci VS225]EPJ16292.1 V-type ATPase subunit [Chlamydia psittaci 02DC18]EPJ17778.1 V-type ATPase subunit [Chlamydia psittaci 02DC22]EPJ20485.1 V-type ATPase subunit [Chlamydia psittaci 02DC23]EPJ21409.1 V-type ATPase subunit [Chlamydia psittaci 02DC21]EPJ21652.1 V-type ATPase subunit [Chlamydia psittaci 03DC29]EPL00560
MRVNVDKYLFIGRNSSEFLTACRELGVVEFISDKRFVTSEKMRRFSECLKILNSLKREYPTSDLSLSKSEDLTVEQILDEVFSLHQEILTFTENTKALRKEILRVKPLGVFSSSDIAEFTRKTGLTIRFFYRKHVEGQELEVDQANVFYLSTAYNFDYYAVIGVVGLSKDQFTEIDAPHSVNELQSQEAVLLRTIHHKKSRICELYAYRQDILEGLCNYTNDQQLKHAEDSVEELFDGRMFAISGWVISDRLTELEKLCEEFDVCLYKVAPNPDEIVPTYLENHGLGRIGEDLVNIYDTPASSDKDPSLWVFVSFFFFFSMIVNDGGYGLVFLATSLFITFKARRALKGSKSLARFLKMFSILGLGCICWGFATTSFFGISISPSNPLREYSLTHVLALKKAEYYLEKHPKGYKELVNEHPLLKDKQTPKEFLLATETVNGDVGKRAVVYDKFTDNILMELALFVGLIHMALGMLRYIRQRYSGLGWIIFMCGAYLYLPLYLQSVSLIHYLFRVPYDFGGVLGYYGIFVGIGLAVSGAVLQRGIGGIDEITAIIQVFSDVLSYLRIYALGLAGAMVGTTIVQISNRFSPAIAFIIILFGHSVNILLSIMGGVIHGLRLNFIEWYHYSFDGGGKLLHPLKKVVCHKVVDS